MTSGTVVFVLLVLFLSSSHHCVVGEPEVPCFFVFGDSLCENGNNNYLPTLAKCLLPPYGIDFPLGATGRVTNGRTVVDILAELLGFENYIPPFSSDEPTDILKGLNYASSTAGIRDESGDVAGYHISMNMQLALHKYTVEQLSGVLGENTTQKHLNKCLYSVAIGSNDYVSNYLMPNFFPTSKLYTPEEYAALLGIEYKKQIQTLHGLGARKFILIGLASIGCTPKFGNGKGGCNEKINSMISLFNDKVIGLVDELNKELSDSKFIYVNTTAMSLPSEILKFGFSNPQKGCCKVNWTGLCDSLERPCENRTKYFYWDSFHPTDAGNEVIARKAYYALDSHYVYPYDIYQLAHQP